MTLRTTEVTLTAPSTTFAASYTVSTAFGVAVTAVSAVALTNLGIIESAGTEAIGFADGGVLINSGTIDDTSPLDFKGVYFAESGTVLNSGFIIGNTGIKLGDGAATITNAGSIIGVSGSAIYIKPTTGITTITNSGVLVEENGHNNAGGGAIVMNGAGFITNTGSIISQHNGNFGEATGVDLASGTLINGGLIEGVGFAGATYAVDFTGAAGGDSLILDPGQTLDGIALAHGAGDFITLGGSGIGTLANPGNYIGWTLVSVGAGASWDIGGPGAETFKGIPTIDIGSDAELSLLGSLDTSLANGVSAIAINMQGDGEFSTLDLTGTDITNADAIPNPIVNFGTTDTIIIGTANFAETPGDQFTYGYNGGVLTILDESNFSFVNLTVGGPDGPLTSSDFAVSLTAAGAVITNIACFASGTRILTPDGEVPVEHLAPGDDILTVRAGRERAAKIIWTGQRTIDLVRHAMPEKIRPVRILAGAFGPGLPERDLRLSPDHALYIDGHLIEAKTLVNGVTVIVETATRHVTYHHIELAAHDVVLAEGLPAETYLESGNRVMFESDSQPMALHPDFVTASRAHACAPLLTEGGIVTAARQRLLDRARALGFAVTAEIDLMARAGLARIPPLPQPGGKFLFALPAGATSVDLLSPTGVPAEVSADPRDRRALGVAVTGLALIAAGERFDIALDDPAHAGFHAMEAGHRWTDGAARIALPAHAGEATLEVTILGQAPRWRRRAGGDNQSGGQERKHFFF